MTGASRLPSISCICTDFTRLSDCNPFHLVEPKGNGAIQERVLEVAGRVVQRRQLVAMKSVLPAGHQMREDTGDRQVTRMAKSPTKQSSDS